MKSHGLQDREAARAAPVKATAVLGDVKVATDVAATEPEDSSSG